jgi:hypothetical protein
MNGCIDVLSQYHMQHKRKNRAAALVGESHPGILERPLVHLRSLLLELLCCAWRQWHSGTKSLRWWAQVRTLFAGKTYPAGAHDLLLTNDTLVDAAQLVDQVAGRGRFARVDVTDDDNVHVGLPPAQASSEHLPPHILNNHSVGSRHAHDSSNAALRCNMLSPFPCP